MPSILDFQKHFSCLVDPVPTNKISLIITEVIIYFSNQFISLPKLNLYHEIFIVLNSEYFAAPHNLLDMAVLAPWHY